MYRSLKYEKDYTPPCVSAGAALNHLALDVAAAQFAPDLCVRIQDI